MKKINLYSSNPIDMIPDKLGFIIQAKLIAIFNYLFTAAKKTAQLYLIVLFVACFSSPLTAMVYYVDSENGSDTASGLSESSAWQTLDKVNGADLKAGDTVKFARGGLWRGVIMAKSGAEGAPITYTSYGSADKPKPRLYGSRSLNKPSDWVQAGANLWCTVNPVSDAPLGMLADVGNLIFDGKSAAVKRWTKEALISDNDFWLDTDTRKVWLVSSVNPAEKFNEIEAALRRDHVITLSYMKYVSVADFDIRYGAGHGIIGINVAFITIRNCDISWIGGGHHTDKDDGTPVRYGNGIEFWDTAHDIIVEGCRIWEVYDAGVTNQGGSANVEKNIIYRNNIIWNCEYSFEYFNRSEDSFTDNILFTQNICYNAGYGWGHSQRPDSVNARHIMLWSNAKNVTNIIITDNILAYSDRTIMRLGFWAEYPSALAMYDNILLQNNGNFFEPGRDYWGDETTFPIEDKTDVEYNIGSWDIEIKPDGSLNGNTAYIKQADIKNDTPRFRGMAFKPSLSVGVSWENTLYFFSVDNIKHNSHTFNGVTGGKNVSIYAADMRPGLYYIKINGAIAAKQKTGDDGTLQVSVKIPAGVYTVEITKDGSTDNSGLGNIKYYPNPLRPSKGAEYSNMFFTNLPEGAAIKIYTILGQTVRKLKANGNGVALWDGKNESGDSVASGVYIAFIEDKSGNKKKIKIAVER